MQRYESISNLRDETPLVWDFPLPPHVDQDRLVVDVNYLGRLHKIGGIAASHVEAYDGELSESSTSILSINSDGSAVAGKRKTHKKADVSQGHYVDPSPLVNCDFGHTILTNSLNKPELASNVADSVQAGASSDEAWATGLDAALRSSMRTGAKLHLTNRGNISDRLSSMMVTGTVGVGLFLQPDTLPLEISVSSYAISHSLKFAQQFIYIKYYGKPQPIRLSLFPFGIQADRYAVFNLASRQPNLIKTLK